MLKGYRRRFVVSNLALVGAVLLIGLFILGVFMGNRDRSSLQESMSHAAEPLSSPDFRISRRESDDDLPVPPSGELPPEDMGGDRIGRRGNASEGESAASFTVLMTEDDEPEDVSVLSNELDLSDEEISEAAALLEGEKDGFGTLSSLKLFYWKRARGDGFTAVFASSSYLAARILKNALLLGAIFLLSMGLFFLISLWLSSLAARPMEKAVEMERQFVADISHDLKTPITVVLANNSILRSSPGSTVSEELPWIESTDQAAKSMMTLVNEMLTLSSLESVERAVKKERVDLSSAAEKSVLQMESVAYDRGITVESQIEPGLFLSADPDHVTRIVDGLLENALKYEPDGGEVLLTLKRVRKKAVLAVKNRGSFIDPGDLPHVFERFYRGDKARGDRKGFGLGLPIIRQMVLLSGGDVTCESTKDEGTVFTAVFDPAD